MTGAGHRSYSACSFLSPLSLEQMYRVLRVAFAWDWRQRENYEYGDYLWASTDVPTSAIRILEEGGRYVIDIEFRSDASTAREDCAALHRRVRDELFPAVEAEDVRREEYHGR